MNSDLKKVRTVKIVYFSGTGCTARVADSFEKVIRNRNLEAVKFEMRAGEVCPDINEDLLIALYAVHACNAPEPVYEWIRYIPQVDGIPTVVISVSGGGEVTPNNACRVSCIKRLQKKGYKVVYEKMIVMPSNWVVPTKDGLAERLLEILPAKVDNIVNEVLSGVKNRTKPDLLNRLLSQIGRFEKLGTGFFGRRIKVSEDCNSCGWCEKNCPRGNIVLRGNRPAFEGKCVLCLRCIYGCPKKALKPGLAKFIVIKEGFSLSELEKRMKGVTPEPVEDLTKGYLWKGVKDYLSESVLPKRNK